MTAREPVQEAASLDERQLKIKAPHSLASRFLGLNTRPGGCLL